MSTSTHPLQNNFSYLLCCSNLSTLLHSPIITHHPTFRVNSLIIISVSILPSSLILYEVLEPILSLCCTSSFKQTPKKTSISLHNLLSHLLVSPLLRLHSPLLHSTQWRPARVKHCKFCGNRGNMQYASLA